MSERHMDSGNVRRSALSCGSPRFGSTFRDLRQYLHKLRAPRTGIGQTTKSPSAGRPFVATFGFPGLTFDGDLAAMLR